MPPCNSPIKKFKTLQKKLSLLKACFSVVQEKLIIPCLPHLLLSKRNVEVWGERNPEYGKVKSEFKSTFLSFRLFFKKNSGYADPFFLLGLTIDWISHQLLQPFLRGFKFYDDLLFPLSWGRLNLPCSLCKSWNSIFCSLLTIFNSRKSTELFYQCNKTKASGQDNSSTLFQDDFFATDIRFLPSHQCH